MAPALLRLLLALTVAACCAVAGAAAGGRRGRVDLWPMPASVSRGARTLYVAKDLRLSTAGSAYADRKAILAGAFTRMLAVVQMDHAINGSYAGLPVLAGVKVAVHSADDELKFGVDESYKLTVPATGTPIYAQIEAQTVFGALHALETFSQLCYFDFVLGVTGLHSAPWTIVDAPRFPYRGLLIDTGRHYLPIPVIKGVIDSMTYSKLNVLHWHMVDEQSFPLDIPSYPKLSNGAYSYSEKYTMNDALDIVQYAEKRGVNVLAEIDVPGHSRSWGIGYPALSPSATCQQPLDVSNDFTFKVIDGILSDFSKVFKFKFVHLGGDEVNTSCWTTTPRIKTWLLQHGMNESDAYRYFVLRAQQIAIKHGYDIINWEETFNNFGDKLDRKTVVHNWLGGGVAEQVVSAGLRCIVSNQDKWYLDHLDALWQGFYMNEPWTNIYNPEQRKLILGGEVCMWGEHIDASDIQQTIWPRAAAAAERLWTPLEKLAKDPSTVTARLARFRCLLNERGVAAAPLAGYGRTTPSEPDSCIRQ
ncbi:beta-hexosaminidase 3-like [Lolium rigidum]|uniref:beta-hexosaminidase 3-like n=1 Tax=Lolium rigidum TaxID=89674 RepID=UPI001F5CA689|nr:beta-hexosaminidase 3-like [Lolium rigidum]